MPFKGAVDTGRNGSLISMTQGESSAYAMAPLQARGVMFMHPGTNGESLSHLDTVFSSSSVSWNGDR